MIWPKRRLISNNFIQPKHSQGGAFSWRMPRPFFLMNKLTTYQIPELQKAYLETIGSQKPLKVVS